MVTFFWRLVKNNECMFIVVFILLYSLYSNESPVWTIGLFSKPKRGHKQKRNCTHYDYRKFEGQMRQTSRGHCRCQGPEEKIFS